MPNEPVGLDDVDGQSLQRWARIKLAFARSFPFSVVASIVVFFAVVYLHDHGARPELSLVTSASKVWVDVMKTEIGDLIQSAHGAEWTPSIIDAKSGYGDLLRQCRISEILDGSDLFYLQESFANGSTASAEFKKIVALVQEHAESEKDAERIVKEATRQMAEFHERMVTASSHYQTKPILFGSEPKEVAEIRKTAETEVKKLGDTVRELSQLYKGNWESLGEGRVFVVDPDRVDSAVSLAARACHESRIAFVLVMVLDAPRRERGLRDQFVRFQKEAAGLTEALAKSDALAGSNYTIARDTLTKYATSMRHRLTVLEECETDCGHHPAPVIGGLPTAG